MRKRSAFKILALFTLIVLGLTSCGQITTANSPTDAYKQFYNAVQKEDVAAVKQTFSKKSLELLDQYLKKMKSPPDESLKQFFKILKSQSTGSPELRNEKIEGDKATLEVKNSDGSWATYLFVKEDSGWKMELDWLESLLKI